MHRSLGYRTVRLPACEVLGPGPEGLLNPVQCAHCSLTAGAAGAACFTLARPDLTLTWSTCQPDNKTTFAKTATTSYSCSFHSSIPQSPTSIIPHQHHPHYLA